MHYGFTFIVSVDAARSNARDERSISDVRRAAAAAAAADVPDGDTDTATTDADAATDATTDADAATDAIRSISGHEAWPRGSE